MDRNDLINYKNNMKYLNNECENIQRRRAKLEKITPSYTENSNTQNANDKIGNGLAEIIDQEVAYLNLVKEQLNKLREIEKVLWKMKNSTYKLILQRMYINERCMNLTQVANEIDKEYKYTCSLHGLALDEFDRICLEEEN